jgi:hypothetical protein
MKASKDKASKPEPKAGKPAPKGTEEPKAPERPADKRDGAAVLKDGLEKWIKSFPVYIVVSVQGVETPFTMNGTMVRVANKIDQIKKATPGATFRMIGLGSDRNWAREQGEEV